MAAMDESLLLSFAQVEHSHWWFLTRRRIVDEAIGTDIPPCARILEVGCGTGSFLQHLARRFPDATITGIEPSKTAAKTARSCGGTVTCGTFETIPSSLDESVDLLVTLDVIEHCQDDSEALRNAMSVMSPGARLVLTVPAMPSLWSPHDEANHHLRRYTAGDPAGALHSAGFLVERLTHFNTLLLPLGYVTRTISRLTGSHALSGTGMPHRWVNAALTALFSLEVHMLRRFDLPLGMSLLAVAHKPEASRT